MTAKGVTTSDTILPSTTSSNPLPIGSAPPAPSPPAPAPAPPTSAPPAPPVDTLETTLACAPPSEDEPSPLPPAPSVSGGSQMALPPQPSNTKARSPKEVRPDTRVRIAATPTITAEKRGRPHSRARATPRRMSVRSERAGDADEARSEHRARREALALALVIAVGGLARIA
ncbi:MAG: hypothetical protein EXR75_10980 [Myxococcales bacterium]|nr:hypothetical protein [Myxococcales bacterium]